MEGGEEVDEEGDAGEDAIGSDGGCCADDEARDDSEAAGDGGRVGVGATGKEVDVKTEEIAECEESFAVGSRKNDAGWRENVEEGAECWYGAGS